MDYTPKSVEYLISNNGKEFTSIYKSNNISNAMKEGKFKESYVFQKNYSARYVRVIAKNYGNLPQEHPAAGSKAGYLLMNLVLNEKRSFINFSFSVII